MYATQDRTVTASCLPIMRGLLIMLALLSGVMSLVPPVFAQETALRNPTEPDARVRLYIRKITVHDDKDWGKGEIRIRVRVTSGGSGCTSSACDKPLIDSTFPQFGANDGAVIMLDQMVPAYGAQVFDENASPELGIPVRLSQGYNIAITGHEIDPAYDDFMGNLDAALVENGQVRFGVFSERSTGMCKQSGNNPCASHLPGAFSVEYEIRQMELPDLRPVDIKVLPVAGSTDKLVCTAVQNAGIGDVPGFQISILMDGSALPGGRYSAGRVASGQAGEMCAQMALPIAGPHQLSAIVDEPHAVPEYSESNNQYFETITIARTESGQGQTTPTPASTPAPAADQADLSVSAIKVNGKTPDGDNDCKDGKSGVAAIVKNIGARDADSFVVRLVVDGDQGDAVERSVSGLKDGQEREVRFGDVRLKKGDHSLVVTVDQKESVTESNEGNNVLDLTASCSDGR